MPELRQGRSIHTFGSINNQITKRDGQSNSWNSSLGLGSWK